jgi:hypothetical protein
MSNNQTNTSSDSSRNHPRHGPNRQYRAHYHPTRDYRPVRGQAALIVPVRNGDITQDWRRPVEGPAPLIVPASPEQSGPSSGDPTSTPPTSPDTDKSQCTTNIRDIEHQQSLPKRGRRHRRGRRGGRKNRAKEGPKISGGCPTFKIRTGGLDIVVKSDLNAPKYWGPTTVPPHPSTLPIPSFYQPRRNNEGNSNVLIVPATTEQ